MKGTGLKYRIWRLGKDLLLHLGQYERVHANE
jgi:hypothetical protein